MAQAPVFENISSCEDMMKCVFNLTQFELHVFLFLSGQGDKKVEDVSEHFEKDRSTAYRAMQNLVNCGMCERKTLHLEKGGYYHVYAAKPMEDIKKISKDCADKWYQNMIDKISEMG